MVKKKNFSDGKNPQEKVKELLTKLEEGVKNFQYDPEIYKALLQMKALMPSYSFRNLIVAKYQLPNATYLASFKKWNELGRRIKKGQKALKIFAPRFKKKEETLYIDNKEVKTEKTELVGFITVPVFDISQTEKTEHAVELPIDRIKLTLEGDSAEAERIIKMVHEICPIPIHYGDAEGANGYYDLIKDEIVISDTLSRNHTAKTLVHEFCHSRVHRFGGEDEKASKKEKEVVAEGVAFVVCSYFQLDTSDYSFQYIKGWSNDNGESLMKYGEKIFKISGQIIADFEKVLETSEPKEEIEVAAS